jgi:hypothetical protein
MNQILAIYSLAMIDPDGKFKSIAVWPKGTIYTGVDTSTDTHLTFAEAEGVCFLLRTRGFGGNYKIFPISTRVEESK